MEEFTWLRLRLNKFFLHFVSELVFALEPEHEILVWLIERVFFRSGSREFNPFNSADVVDPNSVLGSFLLKLLLKCEQSVNVHRHLDDIIARWSTEGGQTESKVQRMVLLMNCHKVRSNTRSRGLGGVRFGVRHGVWCGNITLYY